jgi:tRNA(fMet)-specific endonuclease VapC
VGFLIDTSVFVSLERRRESLGRRLAELAGHTPVAIAAITASELLHGVHRADGAVRRGAREVLVEQILGGLEVVPFDLPIARMHARLWADLAMRGAAIGAHDMLIAATALVRSDAVLTANVREFERVAGLSVVRWDALT